MIIKNVRRPFLDKLSLQRYNYVNELAIVITIQNVRGDKSLKQISRGQPRNKGHDK